MGVGSMDTVHKPPWTVLLLSRPSRGEKYGLILTQKKTDDRRENDRLIHHHHRHCRVFT